MKPCNNHTKTQNQLHLLSIAGLALATVGTPEAWARAYFDSATGLSDTGVVLSATPQAMSSYSGLEQWAVGSRTKFFKPSMMGLNTLNFTLSETANAFYVYTGTDTNSPSGDYGGNFFFSLDRALADGESFRIDFDFPYGWTRAEGSAETISPLEGASGTYPGQIALASSSASPVIAGRTVEFVGGPAISSAGATVEISGGLLDGSTVDLSGLAYNGTDSATSGFHNWINSGAGAPTVTGGTALFEDDSSAGLGGGLRGGTPRRVWGSQSIEWTAGQDGLPAGTVFRVSIDGAPLIPEPSGAALLCVAGLAVLLRRRR